MHSIEQKKLSIGCIGAGKVGTGLSLALYYAGWHVKLVINRNLPKAKQLSEKIGALAYSTIPSEISHWPDCWMIAVNDDQIESVVKQLLQQNSSIPIFHTSGSYQPSEDQIKNARIGSLYPLQTFSHGKSVDVSKVPICINSDHQEELDLLQILAQSISQKVYRIKDEDRAYLHLAAVFVNNFTNALCIMAEEILQERNLPFDLLQPLLLETAEKLELLKPIDAQTGPAIRNDISTLEKHQQLLEHWPEIYSAIYELMTNFIQSKSTRP